MLVQPNPAHLLQICLPVALTSFYVKPFSGSDCLHKPKRHDSGTSDLIEPIKYSIPETVNVQGRLYT